MITFQGRLRPYPEFKGKVPSGVRTVAVENDGRLMGDERAARYILGYIEDCRAGGWDIPIRPTLMMEPDPTNPIVLAWVCDFLFSRNKVVTGEPPPLEPSSLPEGAKE
jgi:hypothetical protein